MDRREDPRHELALLVKSRYPLVVVETPDESKVERLVSKAAAELELPVWSWSSTAGLAGPGGSALHDSREPDKALANLASLKSEVLALFRDFQPYLERPEVVRRLRELARAFGKCRSTLILSGVQVELPVELQPHAARMALPLPGPDVLAEVVRETARELAEQRRIPLDLKPAELRDIARALSGLTREEARRALYRSSLAEGKLSAAVLPRILEAKRRRVAASGILDWIEPRFRLDDLGGAPNFKRWLERRREAFSERAREFGLEPPRGLLLVGVQGTGKSLGCRAIAGEWRLPLLRLDVGSLYDKYVGQTEANLRRALATAEAMAPAVLWVDEIEKAVSSGGSTSDQGLSQRVLGTLLTWMQDRPAPVFIAATANDVGALPPELMRRGRLDEVFFFDLPDAETRARIFAIQLRQRERDPEAFDLAALAVATEGFSGAEIEGVVVAGLYHAFSEGRELDTEILVAEARATRPLSQLRRREVDALRAWGREHATAA